MIKINNKNSGRKNYTPKEIKDRAKDRIVVVSNKEGYRKGCFGALTYELINKPKKKKVSKRIITRRISKNKSAKRRKRV